MKIWAGYTNHKGQFNPERPIYPLSIRFGTSQWHAKAQWLMLGVDTHLAEKREFAMADMQDVRPAPTWLVFPLGVIRGIVTRIEEIANGRVTPINTMQLAAECLKEFSKGRADEPITYPPSDILIVPKTDAFTVPADILNAGVLSLHPGTVAKFGYMARNAGADIPKTMSGELAYVQWQCLQSWLIGGPDGWRAEFQRRYDALVERALGITRAKFDEKYPQASDVFDPKMPHDEGSIGELAAMKNESERLKANQAKDAAIKHIPQAVLEKLDTGPTADKLPTVDMPSRSDHVIMDEKQQAMFDDAGGSLDHDRRGGDE